MSRDSLCQSIGPLFVFGGVARQILLGEDEGVVDIVV
jgi:hypothetical protein